ncbi:hypothetical protein KEM52_000761 [Ascosphaera acerosa]|nr:hypothetical protein KEM52_000761 [Ascosphaera acerosa]
MFVAPASVLPRDFEFPADLEKLGYFVNENDQIRSIEDPDQPFRYKVNTNERYNDVRKEALNACVREIVLSRLRALGLQKLRLPVGSSETAPHVPVLITPAAFTAKRVVVVLGAPAQDLGIWAYRTVGAEGIDAGSAVNFAREALSAPSGTASPPPGDAPGLVLANLGQLTWHRRGGRAVSLATWDALPRASAVSPAYRRTARNEIPGNKDWSEHVAYLFDQVLGKLLPQTTRFDVLAVAEGCIGAATYLSENWSAWEHRISAICMADPPSYLPYTCSAPVQEFLGRRARAYLLSDEALDTPVEGAAQLGVNCYSAGEGAFAECIVPAAYKSMLKWLAIMHAHPRLGEKAIPLPLQEGEGEAGEASAVDGW